MTRNEAFEIARNNHNAFIRAQIEFDFGRGPAVNCEEFSTKGKGWFTVGEFNFSADELTGGPCKVQAGFAFI